MSPLQQMQSGKLLDQTRREKIEHLAQFLTEHNDLAGLLSHLKPLCLKDLSTTAGRYGYGKATSNKLPDGDQPTRQREQVHESKPATSMIEQYRSPDEMFDEEPTRKRLSVYEFGSTWKRSDGPRTYQLRYIESTGEFFIVDNRSSETTMVPGYARDKYEAREFLFGWENWVYQAGGLMTALAELQERVDEF